MIPTDPVQRILVAVKRLFASLKQIAASTDPVQSILVVAALVAGASATTLMVCVVWLLELLEPPMAPYEVWIKAVGTVQVIERFALGGAAIAVALGAVAGWVAWRRRAGNGDVLLNGSHH